MRAAASDLTVAISPLGLVELADEEFEVHGPRLNRYASNLAWFLGHHYGYKSETGDNQLTFNYVQAFSRFLTNFTFSRGVHFRADRAFEHITPALLKRVWEVDNNKESLLIDIGELGSVCGDVFVKVAYEPAWTDAAKMRHPGRVRLLAINPSFAFPEYHPHDASRILRFKLKYRFWGCVDPYTEALTRKGWKPYTELKDGDEILTMDPVAGTIAWQAARINVYDYDGDLVHWTNRLDALTTPNHRWLGEIAHGRDKTFRFERAAVHTEFVGDLNRSSRLVLGGGLPAGFAETPTYEDELVELVAWYVTEGWTHVNQNGCRSAYIAQKTPSGIEALRRLAKYWRGRRATFNEYRPDENGVVTFYLGRGIKKQLFEAAPDKAITSEFISQLTYAQARLFHETLLDGDGSRRKGEKNTVRFSQLDEGRVAGYQMLTAMLGIRTRWDGKDVQEYTENTLSRDGVRRGEERVPYSGKVWCPTVPTGFWMARRGNTTYWTGNTSTEGTRQVYTYTEIITDDFVEEYINDELIDSHPNGLGMVPIVHIPNIEVPGSPWGLSDIADIITLNREFNEQATNVSEIINYHAAPVTIVVGAKVSNLERGPKKVWGGLPKDAQVYNLENGVDLEWAIEYLNLLKTAMHEMTGVPETALGQTQPVSNTSGVALSIQYQSAMLRYARKIIQYSKGLSKINELALRTLFKFEPDTLVYDPDVEGLKTEPEQGNRLDPKDPLVYRTYCNFPPPLPVDILVKLNELMAKQQMGLISKRGMLDELGAEFPVDMLAEIFDEQMDEAKRQGALDLVKAQISSVILQMTGLPPEGVEPPPPPPAGDETPPAGAGAPQPLPGLPGVGGLTGDSEEIQKELVALAAGTRLPQRRNPDTDNAQET
jgi:hypothetical protein